MNVVEALSRTVDLHAGKLALLTVISIVAFVGSLFAVPWYARRLPVDYLLRDAEPPPLIRDGAAVRLLVIASRNALGAVLVVAGLAMLVLPGQGVATLLVGLLLLDFPGKHRLVRRLLATRPVFSAMNAIRRRAGSPPLLLPD